MIPATQSHSWRAGTNVDCYKSFRDPLNFNSLLDQQFIGENAQAIDRCGFHSQDDRAERNWLAAVTTRERKFRGREIAFGPDKHQDTARRTLMLIRVVCENLL